MKLYQLSVNGNRKYFDGKHTFHSKIVYKSTTEITKEVIDAFLEKCTTEQFHGDFGVLGNDEQLSLVIIELELKE